MKISFGSNDLRDCCCIAEVAEKKLGPHLAMDLFNLLAEAEAFDNVAQWHEILDTHLSFAKDDTFVVQIGVGLVAVFIPVGESYLIDDKRMIVWASVKRLKLTEIKRKE
ncbi:hypothetical protein [Pseudochelatococcus sp. G4_1912]|uniref:hypothetical protein n=1 Tax=Pseudochelatococcus sp. G4_1912 TaxID=3114288 RepID=UPI0039C74C22